MISFQKIHCFSIFLLLNFSCLKQKSIATIQHDKPVFSVNPSKIKLKWTSGVRAMLQDSKGNYWFGSDQEGAALFDGKEFTYFTFDNALKTNQVRIIQEDKMGIIWLETSDGIFSYDGQKFIPRSKTDLSLANHHNTFDLNALWFSAGNKTGFYQYENQQFSYLSLPIPQGKNGATYSINAFSKGKNQLWIATYAAVLGYDGQTFKTIDDQFLKNNKQTGLLHIRSILEDTKGRLWIGNNGMGVVLGQGNDFVNFSAQMNLLSFNSTRDGTFSSTDGTLEHVFAIAEDNKGNIWFGDRDTGAWKYDGKTIKNYKIDPSLYSQHVWSIYENKDGTLFFTMASGGVYKFVNEGFESVF